MLFLSYFTQIHSLEGDTFSNADVMFKTKFLFCFKLLDHFSTSDGLCFVK